MILNAFFELLSPKQWTTGFRGGEAHSKIFCKSRPGARIAWLGGKNKFWGAWEVYLCEFERGIGAPEIYYSVDQTSKVKTKKKVFSLKIFTNLKWRPKKKSSSSQNFYEFRCESTKITKIRAVNTNLGVLGLDFHSNLRGTVLAWGGTIFLWGAHTVILGGTAPECPPWRRACVKGFEIQAINQRWSFRTARNLHLNAFYWPETNSKLLEAAEHFPP